MSKLATEVRRDVTELANTMPRVTLIAWDAISNNLLAAANELERLEAEVERLRADAERYRWIRSRCKAISTDERKGWRSIDLHLNLDMRPIDDGSKLDAAINKVCIVPSANPKHGA